MRIHTTRSGTTASTTKPVEPEEGCRAEVRIGPFRTREEAAVALEKVEERNKDWESDPDWNDDLN